MKKICIYLITIVFCFSFGAAFGQSKAEKKGDIAMDKFRFLAAAEFYIAAVKDGENSDSLKLKLAHCYSKLNQPEQTAKWYGEIADKDNSLTPEDKFQYALASMSAGDSHEARKWFEALAATDQRAAIFLAQLDDQAELYQDSVLHTVSAVSFNSPVADFSPAFYKSGLVFVSGRNPSRSVYKWNESAFLDLYYSQKGAVGIYDSPFLFQKELNTNWHEGPACFYQNWTKMALTRNNFEKGKLGVSSNGVTKLKIYFVQPDEEGLWTFSTPFAYNNDEYSVGHPSIQEDGLVMYFISDMPGGLGGTDIYRCQWEGGQWSKPENLGEKVNTPGNEMFPFLGPANNLYFASNGHGGLGGLDIFDYSFERDTIINLGYPINSVKDDFGYIVNPDGEGYFSSNRNSANGTDNIYEFKTRKSLFIQVKILVFNDANREPIPGAKVLSNLVGSKEKNIAITGADGYASVPMLKNNEYHVLATKSGFVDGVSNLAPIRESERLLVRLASNCLIARGKVLFDKVANESDSVLVVLTNTVDGNTDSLFILGNQYYEFCTNPTTPYHVKAIKPNYFTKSLIFITENKGPMNLEDLTLERIVIDKAIRVDNIYYDLGKWNIRPDAAKELDKIVRLLEDNPTIEIELSSHTDSRGSDASNLSLSEKRAKAAVDYIISKGIDESRIKSRGYGETILLNRCANGITCTEAEHQTNRRTEFKVLKY